MYLTAITAARQELGLGITTLQTSLLDAVRRVGREISKGISTLGEAITSVVGDFKAQLSNACEAIITQTSLTHTPSYKVLNSKIHRMRGIINHTNTSLQSMPRILKISLIEIIRNITASTSENTTIKVKEKLQKLYKKLYDKT